jgi:uncharacterized protein DUF3810
VTLLGVAVRLLAAGHADTVERVYARTLYPRIARALTAATVWAPFSIAEVCVLALSVAGVFAAGRGLARAVRSPAPLRALGSGLLRIATLASVTYLVFLLIWGLNYQRRPLASITGLPVGSPAPGELAAICAELIERSEVLRTAVDEDGNGVARVPGGVSGALNRASLGYDALAEEWPPVAGEPVAAKRVWLSPGLALFGISGIFIPFTGEANVNTTLPEWTLPFVAAHEVAHQRGFAREDEANYLAYAACSRHPDAAARYAAALEGSLYALGALRGTDPDTHRELELRRGAAVRRDLDALEAWRRRYESRAFALHEKVNDAYLRAQGQEGVSTYGRMVDLLLAERRASLSGGALRRAPQTPRARLE